MKISFPYMGCVTGYKRFLQKLGHEVIMPSKPTQKTIELGVKYSPEFICFPFKVMLGTYIEAAEAGAEVIISSGGNGPCRAGLYGSIHQKILDSLGYKVEIIIFDSPFQNFSEFNRKLKMVLNNHSISAFLRYGFFTVKLIKAMDDLEKQIKILRAYEVTPGAFNKAWVEIQNIFEKCNSLKDLKKANVKSKQMLDSIALRDVPEHQKIRVGIVGEIYVIMESAVNMDVEQKLNSMGIEVQNVQYISDWLRHNLTPDFLGNSPSHRIIKKARRFVSINCGGHDMENIGWMVDFKQRGFDGVVHLMPFACLPELITQSAIPTISKQLDMPILSLSLDEQMGMANNQTRIEAFADLIKGKKYDRKKRASLPDDISLDAGNWKMPKKKIIILEKDFIESKV